MLKTHDRGMRRWMHDQHDRYFSAFANRTSVLEAFDASVSTDVTEYADRIDVPVLMIAGRARRDHGGAGAARTGRRAAGCRARGHPRGRAPRPLRDSPRARRTRSAPSSARSEPSRRREHRRRLPLHPHRPPRRHQPVHRRGRRGTCPTGTTSCMLDQRRAPARVAAADLPWAMLPAPTERAGAARRAAGEPARPDVVFSPMQTMGSRGARLHAREDAARPDLLPQPHAAARVSMAAPAAAGALYHLAWAPQRVLLNRADAVVTVSETTAGAHRRAPADRSARDGGVQRRRPGDTASVRRDRADRSLVYMGSFMPYKNVETLAAALHAARGGLDPALHVTGVGRRPRAARRRSRRPARSCSTTVRPTRSTVRAPVGDRPGRPPRSTRASASRSSRRWRVGTPVVVSDIPIFREIGGGAAEYFDPASPSAVAAAVRRVEERWDEASAQSVERAARFRWQDSAEQVVRAVERAVADRRAR